MPTSEELSQTNGDGPDGARGIDLDQFEDLVKAITRKRTERECLSDLDNLIIQLDEFAEALRVGVAREGKTNKTAQALVKLTVTMKAYLLTVEHRVRTLEERMGDWEALVISGEENPTVTFDKLARYAAEHKLELVPTDEDLGFK